MSLGKGDHLRRRIDPEDRPARQAARDLRGDLAVAAADVEDPLGPFEPEAREMASASHFCKAFRSLYAFASHSVMPSAPRGSSLATPGRAALT